jgi:hypothetical protein
MLNELWNVLNYSNPLFFSTVVTQLALTCSAVVIKFNIITSATAHLALHPNVRTNQQLTAKCNEVTGSVQ